MNNGKILLLVLVMTVIALSASSVAITMLYNTAIEQQTMRLADTAQSQARLLEAVARFDARFSSEDVPGGAFAATLQQIREAHQLFKGFGKSGEFTLAKLDGKEMVYLLSQRTPKIAPTAGAESPLQFPLGGKLAEPMQQALLGNAGTLIGLDYRGKMVLAAFEPVAELDLGIVAKIDLAEIRKPFLHAGLVTILLTLVLVVIGTLLVQRIGNPLVRRLEENEQRLRGILDTAADGIITQDEQGTIRSFNQAAEHIFGFRATEVIGQNIATLIAEPHCYPLPTNDENTRQLRIAERELTGLCKDGSEVPVEITVSEVRHKNTRLMTSIVRNISERKQSLVALHQREEELRLTFENAPVGIYICTLAGQILRANHAFCTLLSYPEQALLGRCYTDIVCSEDLFEVQRYVQQLLDGQLDSCSLAMRFVKKSGSQIPCMLRSSVIHDEQDAPRLCVVHIEDRSEQLKTEQLIREHRERLAHVTRLSTMGEMAASIAHEINQPLSAISTYAAVCQRLIDPTQQALPAELLNTLEKIRTQAQRAGDVIHRMREFIRKHKTSLELIDCQQLICEVIGFAEVDAQHHQVAIEQELEADLPQVNVDAVQIQQVILNLLRNAIEAMEQTVAGPQKKVKLRVRRQSPEAIEIAVLDRGAGLSEEAAAQLFTPFFTTKPLGMGLGLSISHSIINAHGGQLLYTENREGGSIFQFTLPVNSAEKAI